MVEGTYSKDMDAVIGIQVDMKQEVVMEVVKVEICSSGRGRGDGSSSEQSQ
jgi:hypothetical protein